MNKYEHMNKLQLETWHNNTYMSEDIKNFYRDIINELEDFGTIKTRLINLESELSDIRLFLDAKGIKNDFTKFKSFMMSNPYADLNAIRGYFRKQKIEKILNG